MPEDGTFDSRFSRRRGERIIDVEGSLSSRDAAGSPQPSEDVPYMPIAPLPPGEHTAPYMPIAPLPREPDEGRYALGPADYLPPKMISLADGARVNSIAGIPLRDFTGFSRVRDPAEGAQTSHAVIGVDAAFKVVLAASLGPPLEQQAVVNPFGFGKAPSFDKAGKRPITQDKPPKSGAGAITGDPPGSVKPGDQGDSDEPVPPPEPAPNPPSPPGSPPGAPPADKDCTCRLYCSDSLSTLGQKGLVDAVVNMCVVGENEWAYGLFALRSKIQHPKSKFKIWCMDLPNEPIFFDSTSGTMTSELTGDEKCPVQIPFAFKLPKLDPSPLFLLLVGEWGDLRCFARIYIRTPKEDCTCKLSCAPVDLGDGPECAVEIDFTVEPPTVRPTMLRCNLSISGPESIQGAYRIQVAAGLLAITSIGSEPPVPARLGSMMRAGHTPCGRSIPFTLAVTSKAIGALESGEVSEVTETVVAFFRGKKCGHLRITIRGVHCKCTLECAEQKIDDLKQAPCSFTLRTQLTEEGKLGEITSDPELVRVRLSAFGNKPRTLDYSVTAKRGYLYFAAVPKDGEASSDEYPDRVSGSIKCLRDSTDDKGLTFDLKVAKDNAITELFENNLDEIEELVVARVGNHVCRLRIPVRSKCICKLTCKGILGFSDTGCNVVLPGLPASDKVNSPVLDFQLELLEGLASEKEVRINTGTGFSSSGGGPRGASCPVAWGPIYAENFVFFAQCPCIVNFSLPCSDFIFNAWHDFYYAETTAERQSVLDKLAGPHVVTVYIGNEECDRILVTFSIEDCSSLAETEIAKHKSHPSIELQEMQDLGLGKAARSNWIEFERALDEAFKPIYVQPPETSYAELYTAREFTIRFKTEFVAPNCCVIVPREIFASIEAHLYYLSNFGSLHFWQEKCAAIEEITLKKKWNEMNVAHQSGELANELVTALEEVVLKAPPGLVAQLGTEDLHVYRVYTLTNNACRELDNHVRKVKEYLYAHQERESEQRPFQCAVSDLKSVAVSVGEAHCRSLGGGKGRDFLYVVELLLPVGSASEVEKSDRETFTRDMARNEAGWFIGALLDSCPPADLYSEGDSEEAIAKRLSSGDWYIKVPALSADQGDTNAIARQYRILSVGVESEATLTPTYRLRICVSSPVTIPRLCQVEYETTTRRDVLKPGVEDIDEKARALAVMRLASDLNKALGGAYGREWYKCEAFPRLTQGITEWAVTETKYSCILWEWDGDKPEPIIRDFRCGAVGTPTIIIQGELLHAGYGTDCAWYPV